MSYIIRKSGFSLIELLIVVLIIGIIAAFSYPVYDRYITQAKRTDAMGAVLTAVNAMEKHRAARMSYVGAAVGTTFNGSVPPGDPTPYYTLELTDLGASTYTITARPINEMASKDGFIRIDHTGAKTWEDKDGTEYPCWPESGGNSC
ncbi:type IV pilin protein [Pleionea sediminis]|uniref:type IV pilin protein n=1 Tax=Pleionea sediminis TaxID=2569479 RepID=UPI0013DE45A7|nr:type IV pilin protein [Pleionea sediminis]